MVLVLVLERPTEPYKGASLVPGMAHGGPGRDRDRLQKHTS